jgi:hypothetical protein
LILFEGIFVKREEAILLMNELMQNCPKLESIFLCLVPPSESKFGGYQVHLRTSMDAETRRCVTGVAEKHGLMIEEGKSED